jgi:pimeloyl-ACP methyl ester carboxylesterase
MKIRSIALVLAATAALTLGAVSTASAAPAAQPAAKPTIVLLHGANEDASAWNQVTRRLQHDGYPVVAPAVPLRGVASDRDALRPLVDGIKGPKVLVGHSFAGLLVNELATSPDVKALVYVAAFIPRAGESAGQLNSQFPGSQLGPKTTHTVDTPAGPEIYVNTDSFRQVFAADRSVADAAVAAAEQRPILASAFTDKATTTAPAAIRKYAIVPTQDHAIAPAAEIFMAKRAGATITQVRSAHDVPTSHPLTVAGVIEKAASAS